MAHRVLYNEGDQTLYFAPRDRHGRPSVATTPLYTIEDLRHPDTASDRTIQAQATATVGTETETTSAAAGKGQADATKITVTDASDFTEGREYLIQDADGDRESFILWKIDTSGNLLYAREDLQGAYASGATVRAFEMQATFPTAEAADETEVEGGGGPYQVLWEYTINGEKYLTPELIWLTRYSVQPMVTKAEVLMRDPVITRRLNTSGINIETAIAAATQDFVAEIEASGKTPDYYRTANTGKVAVTHKALHYIHLWMPTERDSELADYHEERYRRHVDNILTGRPPDGTVEVDRINNEAASGTEAGTYTLPFVRRS